MALPDGTPRPSSNTKHKPSGLCQPFSMLFFRFANEPPSSHKHHKNSGKTYTMFGNPGDHSNADNVIHLGLLPRIICYIFDQLQQRFNPMNGQFAYQLSCSFGEIYNVEFPHFPRSFAGDFANSTPLRELAPFVWQLRVCVSLFAVRHSFFVLKESNIWPLESTWYGKQNEREETSVFLSKEERPIRL